METLLVIMATIALYPLLLKLAKKYFAQLLDKLDVPVEIKDTEYIIDISSLTGADRSKFFGELTRFLEEKNKSIGIGAVGGPWLVQEHTRKWFTALKKLLEKY